MSEPSRRRLREIVFAANMASMDLEVRAVGLSDVGMRRERNEDSMLIDGELGLFVVADGMGGALAGDQASQLCAKTIREVVTAQRYIVKELAENPSPDRRAEVTKLVEEAIVTASARIFDEGQSTPSKRGMGTTASCLVRAGQVAVIGHVGDSRIYLYRQGKLHRLTEDHTLVEAQIKAGVLKPDQVHLSPHLGVLTRSVGSQAAVQVDTLVLDLLPDDVLMLCSDGLYQYFEDSELESAFLAGPTASLEQSLVRSANVRGGDDNISVVILQVGSAESDEETQALITRIETVRKLALFAHLTYKEQMAVLGVARERSASPDDEIVREGGSDTDLYLILSGRLRVEKNGVSIAELLPGRHFGEMSLLESRPRSATVRAITPARMLAIGQRDMLALMRQDPIIAVKILWVLALGLSDRLRSTNLELVDLRSEPHLQVTASPFADDERTEVIKGKKG